MRKLVLTSLLLLVVLGAASSASADNVTLTGVNGADFQGHAAGPFYATLNGTTTDLTNFDFTYFRILTPTDRSTSGPQENITTVPEAATMLMLGTGMAAFAGVARRMRRNKTSIAAS
jgi:hypothetical protein